MKKFYTGVGSRKTPDNILRKMKRYAKVFAEEGLTLRSGGAEGADSAFEIGCNESHGEKQIFLPWKGYNNSTSTLYDIHEHAFPIARDIYGAYAWDKVSGGVHNLMARNIQQVLGKNLDEPSDFVICWTPEGKNTGGTRISVIIAKRSKIPVFNLYNEEHKLVLFLEEYFDLEW